MELGTLGQTEASIIPMITLLSLGIVQLNQGFGMGLAFGGPRCPGAGCSFPEGWAHPALGG